MTTTDDAALGLRERKNRETRRAIVKAASDLVIEGGYAAATIPRIAERADVAPRTVSTWFPTKDDILFDRVDDAVERAVAHLRSERGDVVDRMQSWLVEESTHEHPDTELSQLREAAIAHDPELRARAHGLYDRMQSEIAAAVARSAGGSPDDIGPQMFAGTAMSYLFALRAMSLERRADAREQREAGVRFLRAALAPIVS